MHVERPSTYEQPTSKEVKKQHIHANDTLQLSQYSRRFDDRRGIQKEKKPKINSMAGNLRNK